MINIILIFISILTLAIGTLILIMANNGWEDLHDE